MRTIVHAAPSTYFRASTACLAWLAFNVGLTFTIAWAARGGMAWMLEQADDFRQCAGWCTAGRRDTGAVCHSDWSTADADCRVAPVTVETAAATCIGTPNATSGGILRMDRAEIVGDVCGAT